MTYTPPNPPDVNGLMSFCQMYETDGVTPNPNYNASQVTSVTTALQAIVSGFQPSANQPEVNTFYITATYNSQNPNSPLNGDTVQFLLASGTTAP